LSNVIMCFASFPGELPTEYCKMLTYSVHITRFAKHKGRVWSIPATHLY